MGTLYLGGGGEQEGMELSFALMITYSCKILSA